ncbi:MAG: bifunctional UDP-N-acetylmuramoyl-tripeptide:D-alanyl-D-alanine ligase/alanine racemase [Cryomorphaceae bacterium]
MSRTSHPLSEIARIIEANATITDDQPIQDLLTDSRTYNGGDGFLFFALKSGKNDGHRYIDELYRKGVKSFVVSDKIDESKFPDAKFLRVENSLYALQALASAHRKKFSYPVLGITGSNGKTIIKEWLFQLLQPDMSIVRTPRSYNSQIGVPLSIWLMTENQDMAILECGISKKGEMERLENMVKPSVGIFANIGPAHQENFSDLYEKAIEKVNLFNDTELLISCSDHILVQKVISEKYRGKHLTWGKGSNNDLVILRTKKETNQSIIRGIYQGDELEIIIPFADDASIENACHCWLFLLHHGLDHRTISERLSNLSPIAMRLEKRTGINRCTVINDTYNSDLASLDIALDFLAMQAQAREKTLILSDILQTGEDPASLYAKVADIIGRKDIKHLFAIGKEISANRHLFGNLNVHEFDSTEDFLDAFDERDFHEMAILVKGARTFRFERIVHRLEAKTHETVMEIDLNKMNDNLDYIRSLLKPTTQIMVMVKAFAYGSGSSEVAATLEYAGVEYVAVAYADEGIALRESGIKIPIMVLNPETVAYDMMIRYDLEPQIYSFHTLEKFVEALGVHSEKTPYSVHIKINSGMNRLGFDVSEIRELSDKLVALEEKIHIHSVFTHLAGSDEAKFDQLTETQIERYTESCEVLNAGGVRGFMRHSLNSNGILRHSDHQMDMVRLGLGLYGLSSNESFRSHLKPISTLKTVISQIRIASKGEGVGYSPKAFLKDEKRIGVIAMGYADGLPRALGNGVGQVSINGKKAPFLGNICMDMSMIDLSGIECNEGDEVEIFGDKNSIYTMAENLKTIPYEVLTNISQRVKRVFFKE